MEDTPENLPKIPRRTAARPFVSPGHEGVTGPLDLSKRRSAQLFTPPGSSPVASPTPSVSTPIVPARAADVEAAPAADEDTAELDAPAIKSYDEPAIGGDGEWKPAADRDAEETLDADSLLAHRNTSAESDALFVEQYEPEEIELTSASETTIPDEHSIEVIAYDDANSLLKAAANEGERPQVDGMHIETTEFSFHGPTDQEPPLEVESFWATEPFAPANGASAQPSAEAEPREEKEVERAEMQLDDAEAIEEHHEAHPLEWGNVDTMRADTTPTFATSRPPWVGRPTPASTQALEELKESEPWSVSPAADDLAMDEISLDEAEEQEITASDVAVDEPEIAQPAAAQTVDAPVIAASASHPIADVLERIAARVRDGEIDVPAGSESNEAAALAAVLTALLRQPR